MIFFYLADNLNVMEGIKGRLIQVRKELRLKQGEFAEKIGLKQGTYSDIENEKETLTARNARLICLEFGINEDWLNGGKGPMFKTEKLPPDARELLEIYDKLIPETQKEVRDYVNEKLELQELRERAGQEVPEKGAKSG